MSFTTENPFSDRLMPLPPPVHLQARLREQNPTNTEEIGSASPQATDPREIRPQQIDTRRFRDVLQRLFYLAYPLIHRLALYTQKKPDGSRFERRRPPRLTKETLSELRSLATERNELYDYKLKLDTLMCLLITLVLIDYPLFSGTNSSSPPLICAFLTGLLIQIHYSTNSKVGRLLVICSGAHFIVILVWYAFIEIKYKDDPFYLAAIVYLLLVPIAVLVLAEEYAYTRYLSDYNMFTRASYDLIDLDFIEEKNAANSV